MVCDELRTQLYQAIHLHVHANTAVLLRRWIDEPSDLWYAQSAADVWQNADLQAARS
jgi:hypothetical protein